MIILNAMKAGVRGGRGLVCYVFAVWRHVACGENDVSLIEWDQNETENKRRSASVQELLGEINNHTYSNLSSSYMRVL